MFGHYHICVLYSDLTFHIPPTSLFTILTCDAIRTTELVMASFKSCMSVNKLSEDSGLFFSTVIETWVSEILGMSS